MTGWFRRLWAHRPIQGRLWAYRQVVQADTIRPPVTWVKESKIHRFKRRLAA